MTEQKLQKKMKAFMDDDDDILFMHCIAKTDVDTKDGYLIITGAGKNISQEVAKIAKDSTKEFYKELKNGTL
jgi:hypothetical protein